MIGLDSPCMTLYTSFDFRGFPKASMAWRLEMIFGKSSFGNDKSESPSLSGQMRWQLGFTCSKRVEAVLLAFHLPSDVMKKLFASSSKTPLRKYSSWVSFATRTSPLIDLL